jgi:hypothetical protein
MGFRIAIGQCNCRRPFSDAIQRFACDAIEQQLTAWRERLPGDVDAIPRDAFEYREVDGHAATFAIHRDTRDAMTLVVFQVFVHTWNKPTFLSIGRVGRVYAEGLLVSADGTVQRAPDDLLWEFR